MTLSSVSKIIGSVQCAATLLLALPILIEIIQSGGGGFGIGLVLLPIFAPLTLWSLFGIFPWLNSSRHYTILKTAHAILSFTGIIAIALMPMVFIFAIPSFVMLVASVLINRENIDRTILLTNVFVIFILFVCIYATSQY